MSNTLASFKANTLWDGIQMFIQKHNMGKVREAYAAALLPVELKKFVVPEDGALFNTVGRESWYVVGWNGDELEISLARVKREDA
jgi:hypothetical protein